jgi:hypothetical protein
LRIKDGGAKKELNIVPGLIRVEMDRGRRAWKRRLNGSKKKPGKT